MTFEQVDAHVAGVNVGSLQAKLATPSPTDLCTYWKAAKPVITFVTGLWFFPTSWKALVTTLASFLDAQCP